MAVIIGFVAFDAAAQFAPMSVPANGVGPIDFSSVPSITNGWGTRSPSSGDGDIPTTAQMDTAVNTNSATAITNQIPTDTGSVFFGNGNPFRWNQTGQFIESRPTGINYIEMLLAMRNDSGADKNMIIVEYDFGAQFPPGTYSTEDDGGKLAGFRVYYSLTGDPGTWTHIPEFDGSTNELGHKTAFITLPSAWEPGANFYLLWVDDNAVTGSGTPPDIEGPWTIDNFAISFKEEPPSSCCLHSVTVEQCRDTNLTIVATGTALHYQWFKDANLISGATNATVGIINAQGRDAGTYFVRVYNSAGSVESAHVTVTVTADAENPFVVSAVARLDGTNVVVTFSEKMAASAVAEPFDYHLRPFLGGPDIRATSASISGDGRTVLLSFDTPRVPNANYQLLIDPNFTDCGGNQLSGPSTGFGEIIAPLKYEVRLMTFEDTHWKYNHEGHDLAWPGWHQRSYDESGWSNGVAVFDAKLPPRTVVGGMQIQTQLPLRYASFVDSNVPCYFFRGHFGLPVPPSAVSELHLRTLVDDFDAAWMNDNPLPVRANPGNPLTDLQTYGYSGGTAVGDAAILGPFSIDPTNLVEGDNVVSVKLFQQAGTSSDITFAYELVAVTDLLPELSISLSGGVVTIIWSDRSAILYEAAVPDAESAAWTPVAGAGEGSYSVDAGSAAGRRFYTLRR